MAESYMTLFGLDFHILVHHGRKAGQDFKAGTEAEAMEQCCLLAFALWLDQFAFLYTPDQLPRGGTIPYQLKMSYKIFYSYSDRDIFLN